MALLPAQPTGNDTTPTQVVEPVISLIVLLRHRQLDAYASIAATAFYFWEMLLTWKDENVAEQGSRTSAMKTFYFLNRYFRFLMSLSLTFFIVWPHPFTALCELNLHLQSE
ncbi:hypothetical protein NP233_g13057 [Leucocoprinus birnbaumii]|uniref:DUF6533 domain-containing protein n=1 Tax=Leucocoprinus birnbaumii TaxID=56174 RepID=A0AAD5VDF5_9AGAR|nr:hypothetical protein NP233_g13057 [Leucocoprinus birnbaumii]